VTVYRAVPGSHITDRDAEVVGPAIEELVRRNGCATAELVVAEAAKKSSPLRAYFEWDDARAAMERRLEQARYLLRSVRVVIVREEREKEFRAFVRVDRGAAGERETVYLPTAKVMSNAAYRQQVVARALSELEEWQERYKEYEELAALFAAIEKARKGS